MQNDEFAAAAERVNTGAEVPTVATSVIAAAWRAFDPIRQERGLRVGLDTGLFASLNPAEQPLVPEQQVAFMARYGLFDALLGLGILDDYMTDEAKRMKAFAAAASFPCTKNHLGEAMTQKQLREAPPEIAEKMRAELRQSGYDPERPKVGDEFIQWMQDHC